MNITFTVKGIHCNACKELIKMELEDLGLEDKIVSIEIVADEKKGRVELSNVTKEEINNAREAIEVMDQYSIIEEIS